MSQDFSHIPYEQLVGRAEGILPHDQETLIAAHLAACVYCRGEAARVEHIVAAMRHDTSIDAPPAVIARALNLFRARTVASGPSVIQRLVAVLSFESTPLSPAFGLRSTGSTERQMIYTAGDFDIDVRIQPVAAGLVVSGQVLGGETQTGDALLAHGNLLLRASLSEDATFTFSSAPAGAYTLTLRLSDHEIVIPDLELGSA